MKRVAIASHASEQFFPLANSSLLTSSILTHLSFFWAVSLCIAILNSGQGVDRECIARECGTNASQGYKDPTDCSSAGEISEMEKSSVFMQHVRDYKKTLVSQVNTQLT